MSGEAEPEYRPASRLILDLLASRKPIQKLSQPSRKRSLDQIVGDPQSFPKKLKFAGGQRLVQCGVGWQRERSCWGISREQSLH